MFVKNIFKYTKFLLKIIFKYTKFLLKIFIKIFIKIKICN